jgi:hypothetical protein
MNSLHVAISSMFTYRANGSDHSDWSDEDNARSRSLHKDVNTTTCTNGLQSATLGYARAPGWGPVQHNISSDVANVAHAIFAYTSRASNSSVCVHDGIWDERCRHLLAAEPATVEPVDGLLRAVNRVELHVDLTLFKP